MQKDFELINKIFNCIHNRLAEDYDAFKYTVEVFDGYQESEILVTANGVETDNPKIRDNPLSPYDYIVELKQNSVSRGENWSSLTISYTKGGQVSVKYHY